jgi:hypothetical protein
MKDSQPVILQNALKISRGLETHYLHSSHRHDYVTFDFGDGSHVFIDGGDINHGGGYYSRSNIFIQEDAPAHRNGWKVESRNLTNEDTFERICERLPWGHRGKDGKQPLIKAPLNSFGENHLEAILANVAGISALHKAVIEYLLATKQF